MLNTSKTGGFTLIGLMKMPAIMFITLPNFIRLIM